MEVIAIISVVNYTFIVHFAHVAEKISPLMFLLNLEIRFLFLILLNKKMLNFKKFKTLLSAASVTFNLFTLLDLKCLFFIPSRSFRSTFSNRLSSNAFEKCIIACNLPTKTDLPIIQDNVHFNFIRQD